MTTFVPAHLLERGSIVFRSRGLPAAALVAALFALVVARSARRHVPRAPVVPASVLATAPSWRAPPRVSAAQIGGFAPAFRAGTPPGGRLPERDASRR